MLLRTRAGSGSVALLKNMTDETSKHDKGIEVDAR